jgi:hypothetical protein
MQTAAARMIEKNAFMVLKSIVADTSCALFRLSSRLRGGSPIQFQRSSPLFIGTHNEVLTGVAMRVNSKDCSAARIHA